MPANRPLIRLAWLIPILAGSLPAAEPAPARVAEAPVVLGTDPPEPPDRETPLLPLVQAGTDAAKPKQASDVVAAPMPFVNPTIGAGLGVVGMYLFPAGGPGAPPSKAALGGMASQNGSWGVFLGGKLHLDEDRCRVGLGLGHLDLRYDYYGIGETQNQSGYHVPLRQRLDFAMGESLWRLAPNWFVGPQVGLVRSRTTIEQDLPAALPQPELNAVSASLGVHLQYDTRNDTIYPTAGLLVDAQVKDNVLIDGGDGTYLTGKIATNVYRLVAERQVVAGRFFATWAGDDAPFYALPSIGRGSDLRGYVDGRYRDHLMVAVQGEWRWMITGRFGVVGFAGAAQVAPSPGELGGDRDVLPSLGAGLRWRLSKAFPMSLRLDVAWGKDDGMFYVSMGEAF